MKERPILFSAPMVRAILDGRKKQTRRVVKFPGFINGEREQAEAVRAINRANHGAVVQYGPRDGIKHRFACPYGLAMDRLFVKEPWRVAECYDGMTGKQLGEIISRRNIEYSSGDQFLGCVRGRYRHARFMPRWASRITLEITGVRVERLNEISEADAEAEGVSGSAGGSWGREGLIEDFAQLWESINGPDSWDANPFVWVLEFQRVES